MNTYLLTFKGRKIGAIGITYRMQEIVKAKDEEAAWLSLYDRYEHITCRHARVMNSTPDTFGPCQIIGE